MSQSIGPVLGKKGAQWREWWQVRGTGLHKVCPSGGPRSDQHLGTERAQRSTQTMPQVTDSEALACWTSYQDIASGIRRIKQDMVLL